MILKNQYDNKILPTRFVQVIVFHNNNNRNKKKNKFHKEIN